MLAGLSTPMQGVHLRKKAVVCGGFLILVILVSVLHINLRATQKFKLPPGGNIGVVFLPMRDQNLTPILSLFQP